MPEVFNFNPNTSIQKYPTFWSWYNFFSTNVSNFYRYFTVKLKNFDEPSYLHKKSSNTNNL